MNILTSILKGTIKSILIEILDEAVYLKRITNEQKELIITVAEELGKIKTKK
jgi:hypothetical protein